MRLRTLTGQRWPARCADGCGTVIPPGPDVRVVGDFDAHPRKTWIPAHSPDAGTWKGNGASSQPSPPDGGNLQATGFTPASALPASTPARPPEGPSPPKAPPPAAPSVPLALLGSAVGHADEEEVPSPQAGRAWSSGGLTVNAGKFESVRTGYADYALPGETAEQLRERVNRVVLADLEAQVRAMRELHERLGDVPSRKAAGAPA